MTYSDSPLKLQVDIISDVVCPWCIIGFKQLQKALGSMSSQIEVDICWHPFELNPQMPPEGQDAAEHIAEKYGSSPEQSRAARNRLTALGRELGFSFDYHDGMRVVNTFSAHQLLHWAAEKGVQTELKLALFDAYFSCRQDVSDQAVLVAIAKLVGLPEEEAREVLSDQRYANRVRQVQERWRQLNIHSVPTFIFNRQLMVSGAQEAETFVQLLEQIQDQGRETTDSHVS